MGNLEVAWFKSRPRYVFIFNFVFPFMWEYILALLLLLHANNRIQIFLIKRKVKGPVKIVKGANSFFKKRGKKAALLIHGFTSSPEEFRRLGNLLARNNISVHAPLLPGHGTSPERLAVTKYVQWVECVEEHIAMLEEDYDEIYLVGNSFGGNLALISGNKSKKVKGIITLGAPIYFHHEKVGKYLLLPVLKRIKLFQKKRFSKDVSKKLKRMRDKTFAYDSIPLRALTQLLKVVNLSKEKAKEIRKPILIMQTKSDSIAKLDSAHFIMKGVKSKKKRIYYVPDSYHVFILDKYANVANEEILSFILKN
jgi:carboxylesterase